MFEGTMTAMDQPYLANYSQNNVKQAFPVDGTKSLDLILISLFISLIVHQN
jgi:hypothetical protein